MELKSWENMPLFRAELDKAVSDHNAALAKLYRSDGKPFYADDVMRAEASKARQALTAKLDQLSEKVATIKARAEAAQAAAMDDPYAWLSDDELARAALLRPFIAEDVAQAGAKGLSTLSMQVLTGRRKVDRVQAWLLMREAERMDGAPTETFARAAMPPDVAKLAQEAQEARTLTDRINRSRPEWDEHIHQTILRQANYDATGQPIAQS